MEKNMYPFLLNLWVFCRATEAKLQICVDKGFITQEEMNQIVATPQSCSE